MSVTTTLTDCNEVVVYPTDPPGPPLVGPVTVTAGGITGDGSVRVTTTPPSSAPASVPTGTTSGPFDATPLTEIRMHYVASPGRPKVLEVTIDPVPPTGR